MSTFFIRYRMLYETELTEKLVLPVISNITREKNPAVQVGSLLLSRIPSVPTYPRSLRHCPECLLPRANRFVRLCYAAGQEIAEHGHQ